MEKITAQLTKILTNKHNIMNLLYFMSFITLKYSLIFTKSRVSFFTK